MYTLNITEAIRNISVNKIRDFIFENYYKKIDFSMEYNYYSVKCLGKKRFIVA